VFQLNKYQDQAVHETADITFYTKDRAVCLIACFDFALCKVAIYESTEDKCQIFTTRAVEDLTLLGLQTSDIYYRTCEGAFLHERK